ncbi:MAG: hypothetical protein J2P20_10045 [Pseudonocardia sp.]|nr:hypothetical protein [Pseudonocardia sp.]
MAGESGHFVIDIGLSHHSAWASNSRGGNGTLAEINDSFPGMAHGERVRTVLTFDWP